MTARWPLLAGLLGFLAIWLILFPTEPWQASGDIYDHLSATRNLLNGDGLSSDVAYPLTTAWEWGRELPQPMLHRPPGFSLLLVAPYLAAGGDTDLIPRAVRILQIGLLLSTLALGMHGLSRRGAGQAGPAWLLLLLLNPLLALAVNWGWVEVACGGILLALWLRVRPGASESTRTIRTTETRAAILAGLLTGALTLLRVDLVWVPVFWWLALTVWTAPDRRRIAVRTGWACAAWLLVTLPWWWYVTWTAGSPWFNPLSYALQLNLDETWWEYPRLRSLTPEPALANLQANFIPALVKVRHGIRFFLETLGDWLPWPVWGGVLLLILDSWRRRHRECWPKIRPWFVLTLTLGGLILFYALLSQEVRHLLVLLPVLAWEAVLMGESAVRRTNLPQTRQTLILTGVIGLAVIFAPPQPKGELTSLEEARDQAPLVTFLAAEVQTWAPGPVFTDNAAVCWLAGRRGVWQPYNEMVEREIRRTVPGMDTARWIRMPGPTTSDSQPISP